MPAEIDQLAANLQGGQAVEMPHVGDFDMLQGLKEPHRGILQDVIGLLPATHPVEVVLHLLRHPLQSLVRELNQSLADRAVSLLQLIEAGLDGDGFLRHDGSGTAGV